MNSEDTRHALTRLERELETDIESSLDKFLTLLKKAVKEMINSYTVGETRRKNNKGWFDKECKDKKNEARIALNKLR